MEAEQLLARVDLFAELDADELASVVASAERRELRRGDVLFTEGEEPNELFVVEDGRIAIANKSVDGRESVVALMEAGDEDEFMLPVTQEELAGMVGASRERVNKAIAAFVRLGWIDQSERRYRITNRQQLTLRAR
jgi:CRP-like cAMP-binding protein